MFNMSTQLSILVNLWRAQVFMCIDNLFWFCSRASMQEKYDVLMEEKQTLCRQPVLVEGKQ